MRISSEFIVLTVLFASIGAFAIGGEAATSSAVAAEGQTLPRLALPIPPESYPADSVAAGEEGHAVIVATIGADGQMSDARVETSSGHPRLDEASVALANDAYLSTPPTNASGEPVSVEVRVDLVWELPAASAPGGLRLDPSSPFAIAYIKPGADFSGYDKLILEGPQVEFRDNWRRQHVGATLADMLRISDQHAEWLRESLVEALQDEGGYQFVEEAGDGVLSIRVGIGDLDVVAPILVVEEVGRQLAESGTTATLVLELLDSRSGELLVRVFDRQRSARANFEADASRVTNRMDAKNIYDRWAEILRSMIRADS